MKIFTKIVSVLIVLLAISACQSSRLNMDNSAATSEPHLITQEMDLNKKYLWGGKIINIENLQQTTELTIISYPLDRNEKPKYSKQSTGRFIATYPGFLEPTDYRKGILVAIIGTLQEFRNGKVDDADYKFPVLAADQIQLHGKASRGYQLPFSIGIGIGIHN